MTKVARRRLLGLMVIVIVTLLALAAAQLLHPPVAGSSSRGPIPGPPTVGDCLLDPTVIGQQQFMGLSPQHPWLHIGPCKQLRFGEVAAVLTDRDLPPHPTSSGAKGTNDSSKGPSKLITDPYADLCEAAVVVWLGLPTPAGMPALGRWAPDVAVTGSILSGPSQVQHNFGQDWVACVAVVGGLQGGSTTIGYQSSAFRTFNSGSPLSVFAFCASAEKDFEQVSCTKQHTAERFGSMLSTHLSTDADRRSCQSLVQRLTGMSDPTAGGKLVAIVVNSGYEPKKGQREQDCMMTTVAHHRLTGPLLGLSGQPIPIT